MAGIVAFISSIVLFQKYALRLGYAPNEFYDNISMTVLAEAAFMYTALREIGRHINIKMSKNAVILSECTFGIYMCHMLILDLLDSLILINPGFIWLNIMIILTFGFSFALIKIIKKFPCLAKYIT